MDGRVFPSIVSAKYTKNHAQHVDVLPALEKFSLAFVLEDWLEFISGCRASTWFGDPFMGFVKQLTLTLSDGTIIRQDEQADRFVNIKVVPKCSMPFIPLTDKKVYGFYHICTLGNWKSVVSNQIVSLIQSGLYNKTSKIFYTLVGPEYTTDPFEKDEKF